MKPFLPSLVLSALLAAPASAALSIHIDTVANEFWLSGSDSGFADSGEDIGFYGNTIIWAITGNGGGSQSVELSGAFSTNETGQTPRFEILDSNNLILSFTWETGTEVTDEISLVADESVHFSYTDFSSDITGTNFETVFEGLIGESLALDSGTGFSSISVVSAVPEPSTYAAFAGLGVLGLAALRRRRAAIK
jgi:hypothetical protein